MCLCRFKREGKIHSHTLLSHPCRLRHMHTCWSYVPLTLSLYINHLFLLNIVRLYVFRLHLLCFYVSYFQKVFGCCPPLQFFLDVSACAMLAVHCSWNQTCYITQPEASSYQAQLDNSLQSLHWLFKN